MALKGKGIVTHTGDQEPTGIVTFYNSEIWTTPEFYPIKRKEGEEKSIRYYGEVEYYEGEIQFTENYINIYDIPVEDGHILGMFYAQLRGGTTVSKRVIKCFEEFDGNWKQVFKDWPNDPHNEISDMDYEADVIHPADIHFGDLVLAKEKENGKVTIFSKVGISIVI